MSVRVREQVDRLVCHAVYPFLLISYMVSSTMTRPHDDINFALPVSRRTTSSANVDLTHVERPSIVIP